MAASQHADVERFTARRPLSALSWELHLAPTERERLRAVAALAGAERVAGAGAGGGRWLGAPDRAGARRLPASDEARESGRASRVAEQTRFSATELEKFVDCSSMWLVERVLDPKTIDPEIDARLRGIVAHQALRAFYAGLPKRFGVETVDAGRLDEAVEYLRACLREAIESQVRLELADVELLELEAQLARDLELFLRSELELGLELVPRRFEVAFGTTRSAPELQSGLDLDGLTVSGKIDRIDLDPYSASGIVQDYKSGEAFSASRIESERRLQMPLYILALRDLVGLEPLGGLYRSLSGEREARGMARVGARQSVPGLKATDYLDEEDFWGRVERRRRARARRRRGDPGRRRPPQSSLRRVPRLVRCVADLQGEDAREHARGQPRAGGRHRGARRRLRLGGRRHREDDRAGRAGRAGGARAGALARLDPRDHLHGAGRRRAA